jgi:hypothetical protein
MKDKIESKIDLEPAKLEFLEQIAKTYGLPDIGKAVRCLVNFARDNPDQQASIFGEVRCDDC